MIYKYRKLLATLDILNIRSLFLKSYRERKIRQKYHYVHNNIQKKELLKSEAKVCSQNGEDGVLQYIFSKIGVTSKRFIEFGAGGASSNTELLLKSFGWYGLMIDGDDNQLLELNKRLRREKVHTERLKLVKSWITVDNINSIFSEADFTGEIDLLSIDIDGNDYWIWQTIEVVKPRLVVIEYNASFGQNESVAVKYSPNFDRFSCESNGYIHGASLQALSKLAKKKGYSLIYCDHTGTNAFFLKSDLLNFFQEELPQNVFESHKRRDLIHTQSEQTKIALDWRYLEKI